MLAAVVGSDWDTEGSAFAVKETGQLGNRLMKELDDAHLGSIVHSAEVGCALDLVEPMPHGDSQGMQVRQAPGDRMEKKCLRTGEARAQIRDSSWGHESPPVCCSDLARSILDTCPSLV